MKLLIASDLHGSAYYTQKLIERIREERPEKTALLGDLLYHGPRNDFPKDYAPKKVIDLLSSLSPAPLCVRGNCDAEVDQMVLPFPIMAENLLLSHEGKTLFCTHGHRELPPLSDGDVLLNGHTHVPKCEKKDGYLYLNCGSVSLPKENSPHSYLVLDGKTVLFKDVETGEVYDTYSL